jgi:RNA polymerase sigma-70 factor (ECF subfamily)
VVATALTLHSDGMTGDGKAPTFTTAAEGPAGSEPSGPDPLNGQSFDEVVLPHLDSAYRLARWLVRNDQDAEDVVQEASLRAFRHFRTFTGGNGRAWFLRIVRNTSWNWDRGRARALTDLFDEEHHSGGDRSADPETLLLQTRGMAAINRAISQLPDRSRDVLTLREVDGLSYRELAKTLDVPIGTIMSTLSRARLALRATLTRRDHPARTSEDSPREREAPASLV